MRGMAISPALVEYLVAVRDYRPKAFALGLLFKDGPSVENPPVHLYRCSSPKSWGAGGVELRHNRPRESNSMYNAFGLEH